MGGHRPARIHEVCSREKLPQWAALSHFEFYDRRAGPVPRELAADCRPFAIGLISNTPPFARRSFHRRNVRLSSLRAWSARRPLVPRSRPDETAPHILQRRALRARAVDPRRRVNGARTASSTRRGPRSRRQSPLILLISAILLTAASRRITGSGDSSFAGGGRRSLDWVIFVIRVV